jgi:hypothetical protein
VAGYLLVHLTSQSALLGWFRLTWTRPWQAKRHLGTLFLDGFAWLTTGYRIAGAILAYLEENCTGREALAASLCLGGFWADEATVRNLKFLHFRSRSNSLLDILTLP